MLASTSHQGMARLAQLALPGRVHVGLTAPEPLRRLPSGVERLDAALGGGIPHGRISEVLGPLSSGKTSFVLTLLATATRRGEVAAWVDLVDALDPPSIAAAGGDLHRLLWVRPPAMIDGMRCTELLLQAGGFALVVLDLGAQLPGSLRTQIWPRLRRAAEQSHTALVILAPQRVAGSFATVSLGLRLRTAYWQRGLWPLFEGFESTARVERNKLGMPLKVTSLKLKAQSQRVPGFELSTFNF